MEYQPIIHQIDQPLIRVEIIKRPSATIKSPYVADILLPDGTQTLGHTPALGCCGLVEASKFVYAIETPGNKCSHRILLAEHSEKKGVTLYNTIIGVAPKLAERIVEQGLTNNLYSWLDVQKFRREHTIGESRFDFIGQEVDGTQFICEVKNVPLADYVDAPAKERKHMNFESVAFHEKISYFPDGYRKSKNQPVSERALKHVKHLARIHAKHPEIRCILLFVIQRNDSIIFQPSVIDPFYQAAVKYAHEIGVEIRAIQCDWNPNTRECSLINDSLEINIPQ